MEFIFSLVILFLPALNIILKRSGFIYNYLLLNVFIDIALGFFEQTTNLVAYSRAIIAVVFVMVVWYDSGGKLFHRNKIFLVYFLYLLVLTFGSSNFNVSFSSTLKMIITLVMFPVGMYYFDSAEKMRKLNLAVIGTLVLVTCNFVLTNIFGIGENPYGSSVDFYVGNLKLSAINTPVYALLVMTSIGLFNSKREITTAKLFALPTILFLILSMKRISLVALIWGSVILILFGKSKVKNLKRTVMAILLLLALYPIYSPVLNQQIEARGNRLEVGIIEEESRFLETFIVFDLTINSGKAKPFFFGQEIWNSVGHYNGAHNERPLHVDYNRILFGTGLVGVCLYLLVYKNIFSQMRRITYRNDSLLDVQVYDTLRPLFFAIFSCTLIISLSGGMMGVSHRTLAFLYLGAISGYLGRMK